MSELPSAVLVPVKAFADAKVRLAPALAPAERHRLARTMAAGVVRAAAPLRVAVVCDDSEVAEWAVSVGAQVIWAPNRGLNAAVAEGVARLADQGVAAVTVVHADLPVAQPIGRLGGRGMVVLGPDRRRDGTNVVSVPARAGFGFSYGPGSFYRHLAEAERLGLAVEILERPDLAWDVDVPSDLEGLTASLWT